MTTLGFWRDLIFNHFCLQVTALSFWIELDLIFTLFCMHVTIMTFWIELDLNFAFFFMQVIHMLILGGSWTLSSPSSACR